MKYSVLIRKLLVASEQARYSHEEIADKLSYRCVDGADIIRQTLMNAVCDPRFKMHVSVIPRWKVDAQEWLERFAERLMSIGNLTEDVALCEMNEMLDAWLRRAVDSAYIVDRQSFVWSEKTGKSGLQNVLDGFVGESSGVSDGNKPDLQRILEAGEASSDNEGNGQGRGFGQGHQKKLEDNYLKNIPPSLIRLAKLIGRSGDDIMSGTSFPNATKSDIDGISVGNDLGSLLPSELALLSEPATQDLFYRNYVTRRLQVFSSASHDTNKGQKHNEGPIIICMDSSSSMDGMPILVAKALTVALCIIAQRKKRKVIVVKYSDSYEMYKLGNLAIQKKELMAFLGSVDMGGNNEDGMFRWLFNEVLPDFGEFDTADLLCISDFGWTPISREVKDLIDSEKAKEMKVYGLNIGEDYGAHSFLFDYDFDGDSITPADVCDSLWRFSDGVCEEETEENNK
ncbi:MAG: hypothetical protein II060_11830 [Bacteroidales bacterium]|nr:hypothetical protein [Bacteroidales bacterium]